MAPLFARNDCLLKKEAIIPHAPSNTTPSPLPLRAVLADLSGCCRGIEWDAVLSVDCRIKTGLLDRVGYYW